MGQSGAGSAPPADAPPPPPPPPATAPPPEPPQTAPVDDVRAPLDQLATLGQLREQGVLTDAEFDEQKARILGG